MSFSPCFGFGDLCHSCPLQCTQAKLTGITVKGKTVSWELQGNTQLCSTPVCWEISVMSRGESPYYTAGVKDTIILARYFQQARTQKEIQTNAMMRNWKVISQKYWFWKCTTLEGLPKVNVSCLAVIQVYTTFLLLDNRKLGEMKLSFMRKLGNTGFLSAAWVMFRSLLCEHNSFYRRKLSSAALLSMFFQETIPSVLLD